MTLASAPVFSRASATVSNTGRPRCVEPPLPGEVPPTIWVPYAIAASEWKVPFLPVKPWQMTLVFLSIRMDISYWLRRMLQVVHDRFCQGMPLATDSHRLFRRRSIASCCDAARRDFFLHFRR